jgi:prepilin-type N-terminal cleavage/methylation domain-containing protein
MVFKYKPAAAEERAMRLRERVHEQQGFTLVELMVAALVLVVGMLSLVGVLGTALRKTTLNNQRVGATNLARELTETARQIPYTSLTPASLVSTMRSGGSDLGTGAPWKIVRRKTTYTITANVCTYDDPADKLAASAPDNKCTDNPGGTSGDQNGDDFRRVTFNVTWAKGNRPETFKQSALIVNPAGGLGPRIITFTGPAATITGGATAHFDLTSTFAQVIHWNADDGKTSGDATMVGSTQKVWTIDWDLHPVGSTNAVPDGTYSVSAQAFDDRNIAGDAKVATVNINRSLPAAPKAFAGGHDTRNASKPWVDLEWSLNPERDIIGYRVYWAGNDGVVSADDQLRCPAASSGSSYLGNTETSCVDFNPPSGATTYYIRALDTNPANGQPREGATTMLSIPAAGARLQNVRNLAAGGLDDPSLTWDPPAGTGTVKFYRVYRDGTSPSDRIAKSSQPNYTDTGAGGVSHTYYVSAVDDRFNESDLEQVDWTP